MGLADVVRSAVAIADSVTASLQTDVTHEAWIDDDRFGKPTYADPVTRKALVSQVQKLVRTADDRTVVAKTKVSFLRPIPAQGASGRAEPLDPRDKITLPDGTTGPLLAVEGMVDPGTDRPYLLECFF